jgi:hypothetical protein
MIESQKHILFFDFLQKYYSPENALNVVKRNFVKEDKTIVKSSHPPFENILIECKGIAVKASHFKLLIMLIMKIEKLLNKTILLINPFIP